MGAWEEIVDYTVPSNTTSVVLNNFGTITKDDFIKVVMTHTNNTGGNSRIQLFPNTTAGVSGFDTGSNYTLQRLLGDGSSISASRSTFNELSFGTANTTTYVNAYLKLSENGKFNIFANHTPNLSSSLFLRFVYTTSSNLTFNDAITSLTFFAPSTDGLGAGSRIQIYRLAAEKVADITVTSNTTQVDITGLNIEKDSEYLLVSNGVNATGSNNNLLMTPNNQTTITNYFTQSIAGFGSSSGASRRNEPRFMFMSGNQRGLTHTHIKLSNIEAYTFQSYGINQVGQSTIVLDNNFSSSTAENITSINQLNIISDQTNGIGSGSRFELYKLY
jgi:hypothetical protein